MAVACLMHEERGRKGDPPRAEEEGTPASGTTRSQRRGFRREDEDRVRVQVVLLART